MDGVTIFVENRKTGSRPTNKVPINSRQQTFAAMFGDGISGNAVGVNGQAPSNVQIIFGDGGSKKFTLDNNGNPTTISSGDPINISNWEIVAAPK